LFSRNMTNFIRFLILLAHISVVSGVLRAQWVQMNSIYLSSVSTITNHENKLFAATWYIIGSDSRLVVDVYSSTDNGNNWVKADFGWPNSHISSFAAIGSDLYAATHSHGVFRSTNDGVTWNDVGTGLVNKSISTLVAMGTNLVAGAFDGIYLSIDSGANWSSVNNGLPPYLRSVNCILSKGENLFTGVYFSCMHGNRPLFLYQHGRDLVLCRVE